MTRSTNVDSDQSDRPQDVEAQVGADSVRDDRGRRHVITAASELLAEAPFSTVTFESVAVRAELGQHEVRRLFPSMHAIGSAILDHERSSMHHVRSAAAAVPTDEPLDRLVFVFRAVGTNLADDIIVRAGVRIALESAHRFPERRLDPFATWDALVSGLLSQAQERGLLREGVDLQRAVWLIVAAGMGTRSLLSVHGQWWQAGPKFEETAQTAVSLIRRQKRQGGDQNA